jgi:hypothetical protein
MSVFLQPIYTQTIGSTAGGITFNNIPQTFTDLKLVVSSRHNNAGPIDGSIIRFNGDSGANYSDTILYGTGVSAQSARYTGQTYAFYIADDGNTATTNTFSNWEMYIPNYRSANLKQLNIDGVSENNSTTNDYQRMSIQGSLWRSTAAITSITVGGYAGNPQQYSTFSLYGITRG